MRIESLWRELELEARSGGAAAWLTRYALPEPSTPLLVGLETANSRRALLLPIPASAMPPRRDWPHCGGLEVFANSFGGTTHLGVRLIDAPCADVFTALAEDVAPRVAAASDPREAAKAMLARLRRWQRFLAAGSGGLSLERQRGLFGELHALREHILPSLGASRAVAGWRSPLRTHQDFQFSAAAIEVKTTVAKQPISVRITSERQLDAVGSRALFLYVLMLDERETDAGPGTRGETLPELVRHLRQGFSQDVLESFDDRLLEFGYLEVDAPRYEARRFTKRQERAFLVSEDFPRITEAVLPVGIGDISYALSLAACEPFAVSVEQMLATIRSLIELLPSGG
ncbi:MAG: PD-(D/E)XK motif protein [Steroidobacteraceae bacterium]